MRTLALLPLLILTASSPAFAALIGYEGFDYTAGTPLNGLDGGSGWSGAWTNSGTGSVIGSPGFSYTDINGVSLLTVGNTGSFAGGNNGNFRGLSLSPETAGTSLYISFIGRMDAALASTYAGFSLYNGGTETLFLGDPNTPTTWGIDPKGGTAVSGTTSVSTETFLVFRIDFLANSAEIRLFENPALGIEPALTSATAFTTKTSALVWDRIRVQSNHPGLIDEIRVGTTYADVAPVPEPAAAGLLLLGGFALAARRRRS